MRLFATHQKRGTEIDGKEEKGRSRRGGGVKTGEGEEESKIRDTGLDKWKKSSIPQYKTQSTEYRVQNTEYRITEYRGRGSERDRCWAGWRREVRPGGCRIAACLGRTTGVERGTGFQGCLLVQLSFIHLGGTFQLLLARRHNTAVRVG